AVNLLLQDGSSRTYHVQEGSNIIGRSNDAHLRMPDTGVSRQHAEITWDGQDAVLADLQSTNGTTVNETPIENWLLADGDIITMGHSQIVMMRSEEHTSELQSRFDLVCRLLLEKKKKIKTHIQKQ